jgi:Uma2 family endonuclease
MTTTAPPQAHFETMADIMDRLGHVPLNRIRFFPRPGSATVEDVLTVHQKTGRLCELVEGILVEKGMGYIESVLAIAIGVFLHDFVRPRKLGFVTGEAGTVQLMAGLVRIPDVAFTSADRLPRRRLPKKPIPNLVPNLAVEVLSASNTKAEMAVKRQEYFSTGVQLVWEVDAIARTVAVYTTPDQVTVLTEADTLTGGDVLPGFTLRLSELFAELDF